MKKTFVLLALLALLWFSSVAQTDGQVHSEISTYNATGFMFDEGSDGFYNYAQLGMSWVQNKHLLGGFFGVSVVDGIFYQYTYQATELLAGFSYAEWGKISQDYNYTYSFAIAAKHFADYGRDGGNTGDEAWQKDWGGQMNFWVNIADAQNRPFRNVKVNFQWQTAFWSSREGTWAEGGYIADKINFKAVNRTYFKTQLETAVQSITVGALGRIEPKIVVGHLYDGGSQKNMYEFGMGFGLSFTKQGRYYEALNVQYRGRFGKELINNERLDLIEIGLDPKNLFNLIFE